MSQWKNTTNTAQDDAAFCFPNQQQEMRAQHQRLLDKTIQQNMQRHRDDTGITVENSFLNMSSTQFAKAFLAPDEILVADTVQDSILHCTSAVIPQLTQMGGAKAHEHELIAVATNKRLLLVDMSAIEYNMLNTQAKQETLVELSNNNMKDTLSRQVTTAAAVSLRADFSFFASFSLKLLRDVELDTNAITTSARTIIRHRYVASIMIYLVAIAYLVAAIFRPKSPGVWLLFFISLCMSTVWTILVWYPEFIQNIPQPFRAYIRGILGAPSIHDPLSVQDVANSMNSSTRQVSTISTWTKFLLKLEAIAKTLSTLLTICSSTALMIFVDRFLKQDSASGSAYNVASGTNGHEFTYILISGAGLLLGLIFPVSALLRSFSVCKKRLCCGRLTREEQKDTKEFAKATLNSAVERVYSSNGWSSDPSTSNYNNFAVDDDVAAQGSTTVRYRSRILHLLYVTPRDSIRSKLIPSQVIVDPSPHGETFSWLSLSIADQTSTQQIAAFTMMLQKWARQNMGTILPSYDFPHEKGWKFNADVAADSSATPRGDSVASRRF